MMFKIKNGMAPAYLKDIFTRNIGRSVYNLRISRSNLALPAGGTTLIATQIFSVKTENNC